MTTISLPYPWSTRRATLIPLLAIALTACGGGSEPQDDLDADTTAMQEEITPAPDPSDDAMAETGTDSVSISSPTAPAAVEQPELDDTAVSRTAATPQKAAAPAERARRTEPAASAEVATAPAPNAASEPRSSASDSPPGASAPQSSAAQPAQVSSSSAPSSANDSQSSPSDTEAATGAVATAAADTPTTGTSQAGAGGAAGGEGAAAGEGKASLVASPPVYNGWKVYAANCERCHGQDVLGSSFAPDLRRSITVASVQGGGPVTHDAFIGTVTAGRIAKGMPPWKDLLSPEQIESIYAYISARAAGKLAPGRPTREGG
ncbi:MAG: c-type cytochrome [Gemmatimonadetes bacterium]|nr:c-type cytochrome [Gemmatimonadota bacterium]